MTARIFVSVMPGNRKVFCPQKRQVLQCRMPGSFQDTRRYPDLVKMGLSAKGTSGEKKMPGFQTEERGSAICLYGRSHHQPGGTVNTAG